MAPVNIMCGTGGDVKSKSCNIIECRKFFKYKCFNSSIRSCLALWTAWTKNGDCSRSCGGGQQKMTRKCMQGQVEVAEDWNEFCPGEQQQTVKCNQQTCRKPFP